MHPSITASRTAGLATGWPRCQSLCVSDTLSIRLAVRKALILAALAVGESRIPPVGGMDENAPFVGALRKLGVDLRLLSDGGWRVWGMGVGSVPQPHLALDVGDDVISAALLTGVLASHPVTAMVGGDAHLSAMAIAELLAGLRLAGCEIVASPGEKLPLMVRGLCPALPVDCRLSDGPVWIPAAILLAGLNSAGETTVTVPAGFPDVLEHMLALAGANIGSTVVAGGRRIRLQGPAELRPVDWTGFMASAFSR